MKNQGSTLITLLITLVIICLFAFGVFSYLLPNVKITRPGSPSEFTRPDWFKTKEKVKEIITTIVPLPAINFSHDGHLIQKGVETGVEEWTFLYEGPGAPAQTANLVFKHFSLCDLGNGEKSCQIKLNKLESGIRIHLEGNQENDTVTVLKLKKLD